MNYWWVNHKQTHKQEIEGGYIWSPKKNKDGAKNQTYLNLTRTNPGDLVFSYADTQIRAVGITESHHRDRDRPGSFGAKGELWDTDGWAVPINWILLERPFKPRDYLDQIAPLLPERNSPIRSNGIGNQGCYLASVSEELGIVLLHIAGQGSPILRGRLDDLVGSIEDEAEQAKVAAADIPDTEKKQLINARRGQGLFRQRVEELESGCRLTGTTDKRFLIASHIKPWRLSDNQEKLDGNNGLLLTPHVDKLFDKGWISFGNDGQSICANEGIEELMRSWGLDPTRNVGRFSHEQGKYLEYHRNYIFKLGPNYPASE